MLCVAIFIHIGLQNLSLCSIKIGDYIIISLSPLLTLPNVRLTPPGTYNPNSLGSDACRGATDYGPEHYIDTHGRASLSGQHNVRTTAKDNTGQSTGKGNTPSPRIEKNCFIPPKIEPGPPGEAGILPTTSRQWTVVTYFTFL